MKIKTIFSTLAVASTLAFISTGATAHEFGVKMSTEKLAVFKSDMQVHLTETLKDMHSSFKEAQAGNIVTLRWECPIVIQVLGAVSTGAISAERAAPLMADAVLRDATNATSAMLNGYSLMSEGVSVNMPIAKSVDPNDMANLVELALEVVGQ